MSAGSAYEARHGGGPFGLRGGASRARRVRHVHLLGYRWPAVDQYRCVSIALGSTGASRNRLNINASAVAAGDSIQRAVNLSDTGTLSLASITLAVSASPSSLLDTDTTNGLQTSVQSCSVAWTEGGTPLAYTDTCSGTTTMVLASTAVATLESAPASPGGLGSLTAGGSDHLVVTLTLPSGAPNSFEGPTSTLTYTFTGSQWAAQAD